MAFSSGTLENMGPTVIITFGKKFDVIMTRTIHNHPKGMLDITTYSSR